MYDHNAVNRAIKRGVILANRARESRGEPPLPKWTPYQLRHLHADLAHAIGGWDAARASLGHRTVDSTRVYVDRDDQLAREVAARIA
jgi:integrase